MSMVITKKPPEYLREVRIRAGYVNRGTAAMVVPYSPETIGRHERGDIEMEPEDAVVYADCYNEPGIMARYCATCPVGQRMGKKLVDRPLPFATLRVRRLIHDAQDVASRLEEIAFDGVIDDTERHDFESALSFLRDLESSIQELIVTGTATDTKKEPPLGCNEERQCSKRSTTTPTSYSMVGDLSRRNP